MIRVLQTRYYCSRSTGNIDGVRKMRRRHPEKAILRTSTGTDIDSDMALDLQQYLDIGIANHG